MRLPQLRQSCIIVASLMTWGHTTSNQHWKNVVYVNIAIWNRQCWINVVYFKVDLNHVKNVDLIFSINFYIRQPQNNLANVAIWKKRKAQGKQKIIFLALKKNYKIEYNEIKISFTLFLILTGTCRIVFAKWQKF